MRPSTEGVNTIVNLPNYNLLQARPKTGILQRAEVGLLVWKRHDGDQCVVGSRLKTPSLPIWVTRCNDAYGILFNPNRDLIRDYHAENR